MLVTSVNADGIRSSAPEDFDVVVVGAGFAGLYALYRLRKMGLRAICYEAGDNVGGTWYWNKYPGARCDVPSLEYSFSFSDELQQDWNWSELFATQPEILRYINHVAERFDLRRSIVFENRVIAADFDDATGRWTIRTDRGQVARAQYFIAASGCLSAAKVPDIPSLERFKGAWYHSGQWPEDPVDFSGKRVGIVGTGSSGIQIIPEVASQARQVYVFQRTPNFSIPARNRSMSAIEQQDYKDNYPRYRLLASNSPDGMVGVGYAAVKSAREASPQQRTALYEERWAMGGVVAMLTAYTDLLVNRDSNQSLGDFVREKIRATVADPEVAEQLVPKDHYIGTKRLCQDTGYFDTYNRDNVTLVDVKRAPIQEITEAGIRTSDGEYPLDIIVFATGYDAVTGPLLNMNVRGTGGQRLADKWAGGPRVYLGLVTAGFPNMFIVTGAGSPSVKGNMVHSIEQHVNFISDCIAYMQSRGLKRIDANHDAELKWCDHVREVADRTLFPLADSWYVGANIPGKPRVFMPYVAGVPTYRRIIEGVAEKGYEGFSLA